MKKYLIRTLACGLAAACVLALGACGAKNDGKAKDGSTSSATVSSAAPASSAADSSAAAGGLNASGKYATVEDFVNSDIMQSQLESMKKTLEGSGASLDITGEGNKLIYTFVYDMGDMDTDAMKEALQPAMDGMASQFETVASSLKAAVDVDAPVVEVICKAADGTELFSNEYNAK